MTPEELTCMAHAERLISEIYDRVRQLEQTLNAMKPPRKPRTKTTDWKGFLSGYERMKK